MKRRMLLVLPVFMGLCMVGCSAKTYVAQAPPTTPAVNLSSFISGGGLVSSEGQCILTIQYANGRSTRLILKSQVCVDASATTVNQLRSDAAAKAAAPVVAPAAKSAEPTPAK